MQLSDRINYAIAELQGESNPVPRSSSAGAVGLRTIRDVRRRDVPEGDMADWWDAYKTNEIVQASIDGFVNEVIEPGWFVEAESEEAERDLAEWLREAAIVKGEKHQDVLLLLRDGITQREVRGTSLIEHVPEEGSTPQEDLAGVKLINAETMTPFTQDNAAILFEPDDHDIASDEIPRNENGEVAAWAQFYQESRWSSRPDIFFTNDEITKMARPGDVGTVWGMSRIESILSTIDSLEEKINDRDAAIKHKAWKPWIFKMGTPENPWPDDKIDDFMTDEEEGNFGPKAKHAVQGDIDVLTIDTDVPDISDALRFDINLIMTAMPIALYALGSFAGEDINQFMIGAQERILSRQVKETRRMVEHEFRPIVQKKAEQLGYNPEEVFFRIAPIGGDDPEDFQRQGTTIRYVSTVNPEGGNGNQNVPGEERENQNQESNGEE